MPLAVDEFLTQYIPPESELQMKAAVFNKGGKSTLCVVENHMCMDGGDLKYFMTGAVKYKPYVLLSATSMRNEVTLSMCVRGNEEDKKIVGRFFDLMEKNLGTMIENE